MKWNVPNLKSHNTMIVICIIDSVPILNKAPTTKYRDILTHNKIYYAIREGKKSYTIINDKGFKQPYHKKLFKIP